MIKKKAVKFLSKRLGLIKRNKLKVKKWKNKGRDGTVTRGINIKSNEGETIAKVRGIALPKINSERILGLEVTEGYRGRGIGLKILEKFMKSSKRPNIKGTIIHGDQLKNRLKFDGTKVVSATRTKDFVTTKNDGFKKVLNKSTGKIRFIRVRGRIIPIRKK